MLLEEMINVGYILLNSRCGFSALLYRLWLCENNGATWHHKLRIYTKAMYHGLCLLNFIWISVPRFLSNAPLVSSITPHIELTCLTTLSGIIRVVFTGIRLKKKNCRTSAFLSNSGAVLLHSADAVRRRRPLHLLLILHCFFPPLSLFQDVFVSVNYPG